jgi:hypothetical protein
LPRSRETIRGFLGTAGGADNAALDGGSPPPAAVIFEFSAAGFFEKYFSVRSDTKGRRKPPRGGHRAAMRRDALRARLKLAAIILIGVPVVAYLIYLNLTR